MGLKSPIRDDFPEGPFVIILAQWLSWLERRPVTAEVESSSLFWVVQDAKAF